MKYDVFDVMGGEFTEEDAEAILDARKEFDKQYQIYKAEKDIVSKILREALHPEETEEELLD